MALKTIKSVVAETKLPLTLRVDACGPLSKYIHGGILRISTKKQLSDFLSLITKHDDPICKVLTQTYRGTP